MLPWGVPSSGEILAHSLRDWYPWGAHRLVVNTWLLSPIAIAWLAVERNTRNTQTY